MAETFDKKALSERDICTKFITPAVEQAGWDKQTQFREEVSLTDGRVIVRGHTCTRGTVKRADYVLYHKPNIPLAVNRVHEPCWPSDVTYFVIPPKQLHFEFTFLLLRSLSLEGLAKGIKPGLNRNEVYLLSVYVPPFPEQQRIVAKVDELMALCDELEARQEARIQARTRARRSATHHLLTAETPTDFAKHWRLIRDHFDLLYDTPETVTDLRQAILQLAVQGKLVPQDPNDEPAAVLLARTSEENEKLLEAGKGKKQKPLPSIGSDDIPYELPTGWEWMRLPQVVGVGRYAIKRGPFGSAIKKAFFVPSGYKVYEQKNAIRNDFSLGHYYIGENKFKELEAFEVRPNDIIVSCSGTVGKLAVAPQWMERGIINQALLKLTLNNNAMTNEYFAIMFEAYLMRTDTLSDLQGTAQKNITSVTVLKSLPMPLPPLAEQKRIVAKVNELMTLCNGLETKLAESREAGETLLRSIVHHLLDAGDREC